MKMGKVPAAWWETQRELAARVVLRPYEGIPRFVAGADIAFSLDGNRATAVAIVWDRERDEMVDCSVVHRPVQYPYVPNFLAFRESPILQEAIAGLKHGWELIMFDGQGIAHPRRCGLAAFVGVTLSRPAIGVAKSRLCGEFAEPASEAGAASPLILEGQQVGIALRTKDNVKPLFISPGHLTDFESCRRIVLACCTRYRIP